MVVLTVMMLTAGSVAAAAGSRPAAPSAVAAAGPDGSPAASPQPASPQPASPQPELDATDGLDGTYAAPLPGPLRVLRPFEAPPTPYAAGHRGVDLATPAHAQVLAAGSGQVSFAGMVAGRGVVVIAHPDGIRTEYEPVQPLVVAGQQVTRGEPIAVVSGQHDGCPPGRCLHWGARRGAAYFDPLLLLAPLGPVRLLPWPN